MTEVPIRPLRQAIGILTTMASGAFLASGSAEWITSAWLEDQLAPVQSSPPPPPSAPPPSKGSPC
ncbi:MAG: hypothetical protein NZM37_12285, partial [Sandaracinaceae bacterium]|nr:hypothetical protein [Sandaracinaceae bacterium]